MTTPLQHALSLSFSPSRTRSPQRGPRHYKHPGLVHTVGKQSPMAGATQPDPDPDPNCGPRPRPPNPQETDKIRQTRARPTSARSTTVSCGRAWKASPRSLSTPSSRSSSSVRAGTGQRSHVSGAAGGGVAGKQETAW